jgi:hypothetical protein
MWFLRQWELTSNNPYGVAGASANGDDGKRIIELSGSISMETFETYIERVFRTTNNKSNEKLVLCGNGALSALNRAYGNRTQFTSTLPAGDTYGMEFVKHVTPFGTLLYKTHPLFNLNPSLRNSMLIVDVGYLKYRYVAGRDTELLSNRQPNNADYREDEWLTEAGLELRFPEAHMYINNLTTIS